ncbi:MAG: cupin domain-containing protein [Pseudomonadota bacterium]
MSKTNLNNESDQVLDDEVSGLIAGSIKAEPADRERVDRLRDRIMDRIATPNPGKLPFLTIRDEDGDWIEIMPNVTKKVLHVDNQRNVESFLLRMLPGANIPAHNHNTTELCYVIEGAVNFGDLELFGGDCHFAFQGSQHADASSEHGALLFLQTGIGGEQYDTA